MNNVRKKAPADLGKRLRKLVKSWQTLVSSTPSNNASPASGFSPAISSTNSPRISSLPVSVSSPCLQSRGTASPILQPNRSRLTSPANYGTGSPAHRLVSPLVRQAGDHDTPASNNNRRISPSNYKPSTPRSNALTPHTGLSKTLSSRPNTPNGTKHLHDNLRTRTPTPPHLNNHLNATPNFDGTSRTHAANKKRRRSDESNASDNSSVKKTRHVVNGEVPRVAERIRTNKVKTTVELIAGFHDSKKAPLTTSDTITKIVTNQIEKEEDDIHVSVVPPSAMPRSRRKQASSGLPDTSSARSELSKTKSDLVQRFLQQTVQHNADTEELRNAYENNAGSLNNKDITPASNVPSIDMSINPYSLLPPIDYDNIAWSDEDSNDGAVHRNAITGEYPDGYEPNSANSEDDPSESHVEKVITENWHGVNGTMNVNSQFHPWTETFTINPSAEETDNVHVLLPYVDI